jgi:hypothetical protein
MSSSQPEPDRKGAALYRPTGTLRLKPSATSEAPVESVDVEVFEFRLPCRYFRVRYKVAESGTFSLTTEFLLRLLRAVGEFSEEEIGSFLGFDNDEVTHAVQVACSQGFIEYGSAGRLRLTPAGFNAFNGADKTRPHVYEVHERTDSFLVDLISFCPAEVVRTDEFTRNLFELGLTQFDALAVADASATARKAFEKHFGDFSFRQKREDSEKSRFLYSVDEVRSDRRAETIVPVVVRVRLDGTGIPEPDLSAWHTGIELDRREKVVSSVANRLDRFKVPPGWTSSEAFRVLSATAPEQVDRYLLRGVFNAQGYMRSAATRPGQFGAGVETLRLVGCVCTEGNTRILLSAATLLRRSGHPGSADAIWLSPSLAHWGGSRRLPQLVQTIAQVLAPQNRQDDSQEQSSGGGLVAISAPLGKEADRRLSHVAERVLRLPSGVAPNGLEILLWPGCIAVVLVHSVPNGAEGFPVAFGVITVDVGMLQRIEAELTRVLELARSRVSADAIAVATLDHLRRLLDSERQPLADSVGTEVALEE